MNTKIRYSVYNLSKNSRLSATSLSKNIRLTNQGTSYVLNNLINKKSVREFNCVCDTSKIGYVNSIVAVDLKKYSHSLFNEVLESIKHKYPSIVGIQEGKHGFDLVLEFCTPDLLELNNSIVDLISDFREQLHIKFISCIIDRRKFNRKYLSSKIDNSQIKVYSNEKLTLSSTEKKIANELILNSRMSLTDISKKTKLALSVVCDIKRKLEKKKFILQYSLTPDIHKLGIYRQLIFIKLNDESLNEINKLITYASNHKNIVEFMQILGSYHCILTVEMISPSYILQNLRSLFKIEDYLVMNISQIYKEKYICTNF